MSRSVAVKSEETDPVRISANAELAVSQSLAIAEFFPDFRSREVRENERLMLQSVVFSSGREKNSRKSCVFLVGDAIVR